jgi:hypothetical protein
MSISWTGGLTERAETGRRSGSLKLYNCYPAAALVQTVYSVGLLAIPSHYSPATGLPNCGLKKRSAENPWETSAKHSVVHTDIEDIGDSDPTTTWETPRSRAT